MTKILAVALGGALGSVGRYLTSLAIESFSTSRFPHETLTVNLAGCFLIGLLWGYFERFSISAEFRLFLFTGVLGGYTTFSTYARESIQLFKAGEPFSALSYILISNVIGLTLVAAGFLISTQAVNSN
jgi:CrcB protein